ncbi:hypothetical protein TRVL_09901 [Trypanosoma vivax]|nr:hypothetical protein TRVL_09901 [Trypanosoma vivax]
MEQCSEVAVMPVSSVSVVMSCVHFSNAYTLTCFETVTSSTRWCCACSYVVSKVLLCLPALSCLLQWKPYDPKEGLPSCVPAALPIFFAVSLFLLFVSASFAFVFSLDRYSKPTERAMQRINNCCSSALG